MQMGSAEAFGVEVEATTSPKVMARRVLKQKAKKQ